MPTTVLVVLSLLAIVILIWPVMLSLIDPEHRYLFQVYEGAELRWEMPIRGARKAALAEIEDFKAKVKTQQRFVLLRCNQGAWEPVERSPIRA